MWRVQAHRIRRRWLVGLRNPKAIRPMCLTIRLRPSLRALDNPVSMAAMIGRCHVSTVVANVRISGRVGKPFRGRRGEEFGQRHVPAGHLGDRLDQLDR